MRAIKYDTKEEALIAWNELESLLVHLHDKNTKKYTYIEQGNILILQEVAKYEPIVSEWLKDKVTFDYQPPKQEELF